MLTDTNKLYVIIAWLCLAGLGLLIVASKLLFHDNETRGLINSVCTNLFSGLLVFIFLYHVTKKKIIGDSQSPISVTVIKEINEIDTNIQKIENKIDILLSKKEEPSAWEEYYNILANLRGTWLEYIPKREDKNCEISIAQFNLDNHDKHRFSGKNYFTNTGDINYSWETVKVLPPTRHDDETIFIYYIYKRSDNVEYENKYGFGKLVAKRDAESKNKYSFTNGFFFNEATGDEGYYLVKVLRIETIEKFLDMQIKGNETDKNLLKALFEALKKSNVYTKWKS